MTNFIIKTLVDVTQTNARKGTAEPHQVKQQANFNTLYNVIGLRSNPTNFKISVSEETVSQFGTHYKGKHNVWTVKFTIETEGSLTLDMLEQDFDLVPFIINLDETATQPVNTFTTLSNNGFRNIIFDLDDK
jgi:hypothetical protein